MHALLGVALVFSVLGLGGCNKIFGEFHVDSDSAIGPCGAGTHRCVGAQLLECDAGDQDWTEVTWCLSEDRCDSAVGECHICEPGEVRCNLNWREVCVEDGSGWQAIEECPAGLCAEACDCQHPETCYCPVEGQFRCEAGEVGNPAAPTNVLAKCVDQHWVPQTTCLNDGLCATAVETYLDDPANFDGQCPEPACTNPNELRCTGDTLERCSQQRDMWNTVGQCASQELCDLIVANTTDPAMAAALTECVPRCSPAGSYRCEGQQAFQCNATQSGEDALEPCPDDESCDVETGGCRKCMTGELRCNVESLETCDSNYDWVLVEQCATRALCSVTTDTGTGSMQGECLEPICGPTDFACDEATLLSCNTDRTEMIEEEVCGSNRLCNAIDGRCEEPLCVTDGDLECTATNVLRRCVDGRSRWDIVTECPAGTTCNTDPALGANCLTECPDPPVQCVGNVRRMCSDTTGVALWTVDRTCATPELCQCVLDENCGELASDGECGEPVCGGSLPDFNCDGATLQVCTTGRDGWSTQTVCGGPELCQVDADGDGGACLACDLAGEDECYNSNTAIHTCSNDQSQWIDAQTCSFGCIENGSNDFCAACAAGELRCGSDGELDVCSSDRQTLDDEQNCPYTCVNRGTTDYCAVCQAGESRCNGSTARDECSADLTELTLAEDCGAYSCIDDGIDDFCGSCQDGMEQCNGDDLETCSDGVWGGGMQCSHACIGDPSGPDYCAPDCDPEDYVTTCSDDDRVTCSATGEFVASACGGATNECIVVGGVGRCAECDPTGFSNSCSGDSLVTCSATGDEQSTPCTDECIEIAGVGECTECDPDTFNPDCASSTSVETCSSEGQLGSDPCDTLCVGGACVECDPATDPVCISDTLRTCGSDGEWDETDCTDTDQECTVIAAAADCRDCNVGDIECPDADSERTCLSSGTWGAAVDCPNDAACMNGAGCEDCGQDDARECIGSSDNIHTCDDGVWGPSQSCPDGCIGAYPVAECYEDPTTSTTSTTSTSGTGGTTSSTTGTGGTTSTTGTGGTTSTTGTGGTTSVGGMGGIGGAVAGGAAGGS